MLTIGSQIGEAHGVTVLAAGHIPQVHGAGPQGPLDRHRAGHLLRQNIPANPPGDISHIRTGYLVWHLDADGLSHDVVRPRLFLSIDASNWTEHAKTTTSLSERPLPTRLA